MTIPNNLLQQQVRRLDELMAISKQRYIDAGGDPRHTPSGLKGDDYLTDSERKEALQLARIIFNEDYIHSYLPTKHQPN
ncbi:MAG: hypothetical protein SAL07_17585 [Oscillatoria sp. PMC 1051.18]|nr:hypothetical protein [Oscillatoria sp. PMC 1050.18]MEC5031716.1 hypothetical protein [Oscillatoria sp. PMC 1051.18]